MFEKRSEFPRESMDCILDAFEGAGVDYEALDFGEISAIYNRFISAFPYPVYSMRFIIHRVVELDGRFTVFGFNRVCEVYSHALNCN